MSLYVPSPSPLSLRPAIRSQHIPRHSSAPDANLLKALKALPLDAVVAALSAWNLSSDPDASSKISSGLEADSHPLVDIGEVKIDGAEAGAFPGLQDNVGWKYGKSPMGETVRVCFFVWGWRKGGKR